MGAVATELRRKSVHMSMGGFALALRWLTPLQAAACALAALLFNVFLLHRVTGRGLLREDERVHGFSWGIAIYPAAVLALILVFAARLELAAAAWALLAFGDGMATVTGVLTGGPRLPWNRRKSWAGLAAFIVFGTAASTFLMNWVTGREASGAWTSLAVCLAAAAAAALAESLETGLDDNIVVPVVGALVLSAGFLVEPARLAAAAPAVVRSAAVGAAVNLVLAALAHAARGVSLSGAVSGWCLGTMLWALAGWRGFLMLLGFFVLGTATTMTGYRRKAKLGVAQERGGRRGARNAFANVTAGLGFAFLAVATSYPEAFHLALVAAFATAASDTVASEIGQAFGRRHYLVTTLRRVPAGTDGAVSVEGTLAGIAASVALGGLAFVAGLVPAAGVAIVAIAAFAGTALESYLGALFEGARRIDNELVNFVNTVAGGLVALLLHHVLAR